MSTATTATTVLPGTADHLGAPTVLPLIDAARALRIAAADCGDAAEATRLQDAARVADDAAWREMHRLRVAEMAAAAGTSAPT